MEFVKVNIFNCLRWILDAYFSLVLFSLPNGIKLDNTNAHEMTRKQKGQNHHESHPGFGPFEVKIYPLFDYLTFEDKNDHKDWNDKLKWKIELSVLTLGQSGNNYLTWLAMERRRMLQPMKSSLSPPTISKFDRPCCIGKKWLNI